MEEWKQRLIEEYAQTKERFDRLHKRNIQNLAQRLLAEEPISRKDTECMDIMVKQERAMREYLYCLELRAELCGVVL